MVSITISKEKIEKYKGVVIVPIREYEKLLAIPTHCLIGKATKKKGNKLVGTRLQNHR